MIDGRGSSPYKLSGAFGMVPSCLGMLEDYPRLLPNSPDQVTLPAGHQFIMPQGTPQLIAWPSW